MTHGRVTRQAGAGLLAAFEVSQRFYQIGSLAGRDELEALFSAAHAMKPAGAMTSRSAGTRGMTAAVRRSMPLVAGLSVLAGTST